MESSAALLHKVTAGMMAFRGKPALLLLPSSLASSSHVARIQFSSSPVVVRGNARDGGGEAVFGSRQCLMVEARRKPTRTESAKVQNLRMRKKFNGTTEQPRLSVFRSKKHIYAQVVDDSKKRTLVAASTNQLVDFEHFEQSLSPIEDAAKQIGREIAKRCLEIGVVKVKLDRNGFSGRGGIQALADAVQENGILYS
ncbi:hypothetical protein O6H91_07G093600 [Diphasiastrum complanatum]|uniref:Uncharacterized protein n=2 Tax=Diphasiastrum complanatum TaxID=34168 RepID=A0ACC2D842_DIPCM|nr:hypothetical protein O6H91_07G049900 [Diphasiastrum complanatum]KAJ7550298.1 hypothetical protein O6H91_07G093600 [Diphasiastrum complanatum]